MIIKKKNKMKKFVFVLSYLHLRTFDNTKNVQ